MYMTRQNVPAHFLGRQLNPFAKARMMITLQYMQQPEIIITIKPL